MKFRFPQVPARQAAALPAIVVAMNTIAATAFHDPLLTLCYLVCPNLSGRKAPRVRLICG